MRPRPRVLPQDRRESLVDFPSRSTLLPSSSASFLRPDPPCTHPTDPTDPHPPAPPALPALPTLLPWPFPPPALPALPALYSHAMDGVEFREVSFGHAPEAHSRRLHADRRCRRGRGARRRQRRRQDHRPQAGQSAAAARRRRGAVQGRDTREWDPIRLRRSVGYVIQDVGLFPHLTVADNIAVVPRLEAVGRRSRGRPRARAARADRARARRLRRPLARRAVRRPAPARRRRARARRRSAGAADGRAVRRARSGHAAPAAGRVPPHPGARCARRVHPRHARHGRSAGAGRSHRRAGRRAG